MKQASLWKATAERLCLSEQKKQKGVTLVPIKLEAWGEYALFTRPEMKVNGSAITL